MAARGRRTGAWTAALALAAASPAAAADDGISWLFNEPVTLFDLGMVRLRQDMAEAARWLSETGHAAGKPWSGAFYQWRERRIVAYVTLQERLSDPDGHRCREIFALTARRLTQGLPEGTRRAAMYLEDLFAHPGVGNWGGPRHLGEELVRFVRFEVTLLPPPPADAGGRRVSCAGPLDAARAEITVSAAD